jgi:hypothetical protein
MIPASEIADFLNKKLYGDNIEVHRPVPLDSISANTVTFAKKLSVEIIEKINATL